MKAAFTFLPLLCFLFLPLIHAQLKTDYMPLTIGNKWLYTHVSGPFLKSRTGIISKEIIKGEAYFVAKTTTYTSDSYHTYSRYYRISNDTLFTLFYDDFWLEYFERIYAIFSLEIGETAVSYPDAKIIARLKQQNLPVTGFKIQLLDKKDDLMVFRLDGGTETESIIAYQKGIGPIQYKTLWGGELKLINYNLK